MTKVLTFDEWLESHHLVVPETGCKQCKGTGECNCMCTFVEYECGQFGYDEVHEYSEHPCGHCDGTGRTTKGEREELKKEYERQKKKDKELLALQRQSTPTAGV